ncbi:Sugar transferase involved in LPS biosynthesis (colanic, teichoic acid) [bacterium A37T11]|nr:Sugar transferase involved in LPS biosynthesis (colanic, teichoic acid) [bacterium A37T11]
MNGNQQIRHSIYKDNNEIVLTNNYSFEQSIRNFITYPQAFKLSEQLNKQAILDEGTVMLKRGFDIVFSLLVMIAGLPVFLLLMLITKVTSKGSIFYKQERVGLDETPFYIYKFRSMRVDAEKFGPQLASENDPRVTKWGRIMRKTRLDELPQFWNVLKGDMSVVGPRPERSHFIKKIAEQAPEYKKLLNIKPGITSFGQVCYGYAESVEEMCDRMLFDLSYLSRVNLVTDLSIIFQTVKVMIEGRGK